MSESRLLDSYHQDTSSAYDRGYSAGLERAAVICREIGAHEELLPARQKTETGYALKKAAARILGERRP